ncbi:hypothetical protein E2C01_009552 [Portunus trituberculatus]|uniref:Uncharacterized protein n=1 Tax=Portunus trituberculatus TaxID=210409 RepID=A0A5B7D630_PORTR|nr:hypothetical protein [Portunus trituberculatus]
MGLPNIFFQVHCKKLSSDLKISSSRSKSEAMKKRSRSANCGFPISRRFPSCCLFELGVTESNKHGCHCSPRCAYSLESTLAGCTSMGATSAMVCTWMSSALSLAWMEESSASTTTCTTTSGFFSEPRRRLRGSSSPQARKFCTIVNNRHEYSHGLCHERQDKFVSE